jgi:Flp pilus assembly protein TadB
MNTATQQPSVVWAAVLCAALAALMAGPRADSRRRARDLLLGPGPEQRRPEQTRTGQDERTPAPGRTRTHPLDRLRAAVRRRADVPGRGVGWLPGPLGRIGVEVMCLPVGGGLGLLTGSLLPVVAGAAAMPLAGRVLRRRAERAAAERGAVAVSALCGTVAGDLRAGRPPHTALADAVESAGWTASPDLADSARMVLSAARFGGDVPHALREASRLGAGTQGLAAVAACWQVAVDGGAGLAAALDRVAMALRADADQRDDLRAQLAGPRSTAVLLALLPLFGIVLGAGLGADPSAVLLHTPAGLLCLVAGGCLEWAGLAWTARIIRSAEGRPAAADPRRKPRAAGPREGGRP